MTCVSLEDIAKNELGSLAILCNERSGRLLDALAVRVGEPGTLIGEPRVRVFLEVDQHIAIGEPRGVESRRCRDYPAQFLACRLRAAASAMVPPE